MNETVRIDDLREPRLDAAQRAALEYVATLDIRFDADEMLALARGRAACDDFGDDGFRPRLDAMLDAVEADTGLGPLGRLAIHQRTLRLLTSRLLVEDLVGRRPEILEIELPGADRRDRAAPLGNHAPRQPDRQRHPPAVAPVLGEPRAVPAAGRRTRARRCRPALHARCVRDYDAQMQMVPDAPRDAPPVPDRDRGGDRAPGPRLLVVHARVARPRSRLARLLSRPRPSERTTRT